MARIRHRNVRTNTCRARIWRVIRAFPGEWTFDDIVQLADVGYANTTIYISLLLKSGHVRQTRTIPLESGSGKARSVFRLVRNTGPLPPVQSHITMVYDPNRDEYWMQDPDGVRVQIRSELVRKGLLKQGLKGAAK